MNEQKAAFLVTFLKVQPQEPPFGEIFDSSGFVVRWPMEHVGSELLDILRAVPKEAYEEMNLGQKKHKKIQLADFRHVFFYF